MKALAIFDNSFRLYADSSAHRTNRPLFLPETDGGLTAIVCPAVKISRLGMHISEKFARRYFDSLTLAAMMVPTASADSPEIIDERYYAMDSAFMTGQWHEIDDFDRQHIASAGDRELEFSATGLDIDKKLSELSRFMTLKMGDCLIFASKNIKIPLNIDGRVCVSLDNKPCIDLKIK